MGQASGDPTEDFLLRRCLAVLDEQMAAFEEVADSLLEALSASYRPFRGLRRASAPQGGHGGGQRLTDLGHGMHDGLGEFLEDVELADLMGDMTEDLDKGDWVKR